MKRQSIIMGSIMGLLLTGCSFIPEYSRPEAPVAQEWPAGPAYENAPVASEEKLPGEIPWRDFLPTSGCKG